MLRKLKVFDFISAEVVKTSRIDEWPFMKMSLLISGSFRSLSVYFF